MRHYYHAHTNTQTKKNQCHDKVFFISNNNNKQNKRKEKKIPICFGNAFETVENDEHNIAKSQPIHWTKCLIRINRCVRFNAVHTCEGLQSKKKWVRKSHTNQNALLSIAIHFQHAPPVMRTTTEAATIIEHHHQKLCLCYWIENVEDIKKWVYFPFHLAKIKHTFHFTTRVQ